MSDAKMTREHLDAVREAIGNAESEAAAHRECAGMSAAETWQAKHLGRAKAGDDCAARLAEVAAHIEQQIGESRE